MLFSDIVPRSTASAVRALHHVTYDARSQFGALRSHHQIALATHD